MAVESTLKHLWNCANELDSASHTKKLLKSFYITTCRKIANNNVQLPKEKFAVSQMCPRCSSFWNESEFKLKLKPQQVAKSGKAKKLIAKMEEAVSTQKKGVLSKKQRRRAKWLKKRVCSNVEIHCENCKQKSLIPLQKPDKKLKTLEVAEVAEEAVAETTPTPKAKKKKSKKKDLMAGLKITPKVKKDVDAPSVKLESAKPAKEMKKSVKGFKQSTKSNPFSTDANKKPSTKSPNLALARKAMPNLSQTLKAKKKKSKSKAAPTPVVPTVQSKTQQKNSLLQLAALLKKQGPKTNTAQNRLETMLQ